MRLRPRDTHEIYCTVYLVQVPLGHVRAPARCLRDRAGPERAPDRAAAALRPLLAAFLVPVHVLRWRAPLPRVLSRRARHHSGVMGLSRSGAGICSPSM